MPALPHESARFGGMNVSGKQQRVPEEYLPIFCKELHGLVRSGIPISEGMRLLLEDEEDPQVLSWLESLHAFTQDGMPLSQALGESGAFPSYMTDMICLAEETGRLEDALLSLARYYDRRNRMRSDVRSAVTVPVVLLVVMIAVVVLLVTRVLPVFNGVFAQLGARMGAVATGMMNAGAALARAGTGLAAAVAVIAVLVLIVALLPSLRDRFAGAFQRRFGGRGILGQMAVSRFASSMAMATASGMSMEESVELASRLCGGAKEIDARTARCREAILDGSGPADALADSGLFSSRDCRLMKLAEQTGSLHEALEDIAARQEEESLRRIDRLVSAIEPAIVVITSVLAGIILVSVMLPLMGLLSTAG